MTAINDYISKTPWTNLIDVSPSSFDLEFTLNKEEYLKLNIKNLIQNPNEMIAWKLKTNRPGRYMVSPKQGLISYNTSQSCTVVLTKLQEIPSISKPDKFLIQATKIIANSINETDLSQLWKDRESKHNKKQQIYTYQAITIKCYLKQSKSNQNITKIDEIKTQNIDNSISTTNEFNEAKNEKNEEIEKKNEIKIENIMDEDISNNENIENNIDNNNNKNELIFGKYNEIEIESWKKKFDQFGSLLEFAKKTLREKDELQTQQKKYEIENEKLLMEINDLKKEKNIILKNRVNNLNNNNNNGNLNNGNGNSIDNDIKQDIDIDNDIKDENNDELLKFDKMDASILSKENMDGIKKNEKGFQISVLQIFIMLLISFISFKIGGWSQKFEQSHNTNNSDVQKNDL